LFHLQYISSNMKFQALVALFCVSVTAAMIFPGLENLESFKSVNTSTSTNYRPVVLMHGLGDSGANPGMQSLAQSVSAKYPGMYATAIQVADGMDSFFTLMGDQVDQFAAAVRKDPKLAKGFNAVGLSQGNLVVRGYIQKYNDPPVFNFVSICGPHEGVGTCPSSVPGFICDIFKLGPYTAKLSFAGYWKDVSNKAEFLKASTFLADMDNEKDQKNAQYKTNMMSLNKYVLVMALNDTVVIPKESEQHGFWAWGNNQDVVTLRDTDSYKGDWLGLQSMDKAKKIDLLSFVGEHIRFTDQYWNDVILPYLNNSF